MALCNVVVGTDKCAEYFCGSRAVENLIINSSTPTSTFSLHTTAGIQENHRNGARRRHDLGRRDLRHWSAAVSALTVSFPPDYSSVLFLTDAAPVRRKRALSRSDKKILHIDPNDYYGGSEAAFSLQEADEWAARVCGQASDSIFSSASTCRPAVASHSFSRAYSLALAPQLIYARSELLSQLVSSRAHSQIEFLAIGSCFVFRPSSLARIPSTREDVFSNASIPARSKRQLMKFLKFVLDYETEPQAEIWRPCAGEMLVDFLQREFKLDEELRTYVLTLTLSLDGKITVEDGLAIIHKQLRSMGVFGPGFAAVYPKYGGISEIAQVGCRAGAVGGAVYMLGTGIEEVQPPEADGQMRIKLTSGDWITTKTLVRGSEGVPADGQRRLSRLVAVIGSPLSSLFETVVEGAPTPAVAVIAFPPSSVTLDDGLKPEFTIFALAHSSETGECPAGQSKRVPFPLFSYQKMQ